MSKSLSGIIAGISATVVLSILMMIKGKMGVMPDLNVIAMLAGMVGKSLIVGWVMHFLIGTGYGVIFQVINGMLPTNNMIVKGIILLTIGWFAMMLIVMPMLGAGIFAISMGVMAPVMTFVLHIIFGTVLGYVYSKFS